LSTDVTQSRRFVTGLDVLSPGTNELQRADSAPRSTGGDGIVNSGDVVQARRYATGLDPLTNAGGPTTVADGELHAVIGGSLFGQKTGGASVLRLSSNENVGRRVDVHRSVGIGVDAAAAVSAAVFKIAYDPRLGKPTVTLADGTSKGAALTVNDTVDGELVILVDSANPFTHNGGLVRIVEIVFESIVEGDDSITFVGAPSLSDAFGRDVQVVVYSEAQARW
jgi:hypothetical protein